MIKYHEQYKQKRFYPIHFESFATRTADPVLSNKTTSFSSGNAISHFQTIGHSLSRKNVSENMLLHDRQR